MRPKYIYLFDTCAWVHYYKGEPKVKTLLDHIIEQKGLNKATLFMPSFCITEVFNTFAKWRYRGEDITINEDEYKGIKEKFRSHIRRGALITEYPLHIYHTYNTDYIIPFEHQWETHNGALSTFDILILGMGIELVKHYGDFPVRIITAEKRLAGIAKWLREKTAEGVRKQYGIPTDVVYPQTLYAHASTTANLPHVKEQK